MKLQDLVHQGSTPFSSLTLFMSCAKIHVKRTVSIYGSYVPRAFASSGRCHLNFISSTLFRILQFTSRALCDRGKCLVNSARYADVVIAKVETGRTDEEICQSLLHDQTCSSIPFSQDLVSELLNRFNDDWKSALGVFKWAKSHPSYEPSSEWYEILVDILGKMKQMEKMRALVEDMHQFHGVTIGCVAKVMRRLAGAGKWEDAVRVFDELDRFGLKKNTESMNLLLDTLCKENKVEQARKIFLELKSHIPPTAHTFNIFIHGWCKVNRVDEAHWTIQEMKGSGCSPCVISYSTIIKSYCQHGNFNRAYELLDEMQADGCAANVVTFTTIMSYMTKSEKFEEALQIPKKMKAVGCKPDTLFYNALICALSRAGEVDEAVRLYQLEMASVGVARNTSTYNTMISMFCHLDLEQEAMDILGDMEISKNCSPDIQSFIPLLKLCFRTGKTDVLLDKLLDKMVGTHRLCLDLSTYTLLIHGLCRANKCERAYLFFREMVALDIRPRYQTCQLLLDEVKQVNDYAAADMIEAYIKQMKSSSAPKLPT